MIEQTVQTYLNQKLNVPVRLEAYRTPDETEPSEYVLIEKVGGGRTNQVRSASFAFQSYSNDSMFKAASLNELVKQHMDAFAQEDTIGACHMASDYNHTDLSTKKYRYQCTYDITYF